MENEKSGQTIKNFNKLLHKEISKIPFRTHAIAGLDSGVAKLWLAIHWK